MKQKVSFVGTVNLERKTKKNEVKTLLDTSKNTKNYRFDLQDSKFSRTKVGSLPVRSFELMSLKSETFCEKNPEILMGQSDIRQGRQFRVSRVATCIPTFQRFTTIETTYLCLPTFWVLEIFPSRKQLLPTHFSTQSLQVCKY